MKDKTFHYTNENMVKDLVCVVPFNNKDVVLDAGSGSNKVWFRNIPSFCDKYECEIDDGFNFYNWDKRVDWVVGNPPYHESWKFTKKASNIANKGFAWLINNQALNSHFTPRRLQMLNEQGFGCSKIHIVNDKRWFGRYFFIVFSKCKGMLTWETKTY